MSFNRDNVIWRSANGSWNLGFYTVHESVGPYGDDEDDYDPEWDVDYDYGSFEWVSTGHASSDDAMGSWKGANPGMHSIETRPERSLELDAMAKEFLARGKR